MASIKEPPMTTNMKASISLLEIFVFAVLVALIITLESVPFSVRLLATGLVSPIIVLSIIFSYFCRKRKIWSFAGASILGAIGVILRVLISTQSSLEVGGGLPVGVTVLYIVLGSLVSLKSYESVLDLEGYARV